MFIFCYSTESGKYNNYYEIDEKAKKLIELINIISFNINIKG